MSDKYWMVHVSGSDGTKVVHKTLELATAEARRLALSNIGRIINVLEVVASYKADEPVVRLIGPYVTNMSEPSNKPETMCNGFLLFSSYIGYANCVKKHIHNAVLIAYKDGDGVDAIYTVVKDRNRTTPYYMTFPELESEAKVRCVDINVKD